MEEHIKREDAINLLWLYADESCASVVSDFESLPAADVVEVVRCRECVHNHPEFVGNETQWCELCRTTINPDDFCSRGQRKEGENVRDN